MLYNYICMTISNTQNKKQPFAEVLHNFLNKLKGILHGSFYNTLNENI